ncbi:MAG: DUF87 domain-containing protein, partial [Oscillospiraceae bacterium]|nr:DUF87 domain-containing protein [Oscillospiraceae bacterium]
LCYTPAVKCDTFFDGCYRYEYNKKVLEANIEKGQNAVKKHMCITLTIKASDEEAAADRFKSIDISIIDAFNNIGATNMRVMTSQERVEMLKDYFIGTDYNIPQITDEQYTKGEEKLFCSPDYFEFKYDYFMFNEYYARAMYVKDFPNRAGSTIVKDIIDTSLDCIVTVNLSCLAPDAAQKLVRKKMYEIDTDMSARSRKAAQHGDFTSTIPETIRIKRESLSKIYEKITEQDQRLFFANVIIMVKSKELSELNSNCRIIEDIFKRNSYLTGKLTFQQEAAMNDCLPCGYKRRLDIQRTMPSESAAIFLPFNVTEVQMPNASYYGLNKLSNNIIMFDRVTGLKNPSGFFLGCPGSGKSFTAKREMVDVILRNPDADVLIVDPEREYQGIVTEFGGTVVKFGGNSKSYINPFAYSMSMLDVDDDDSEFGSIIDSKTSLIQSFMSVMDSKNPLTAQEQSFVDRCIKKCYLKTGVLETQNPDDMPTLSTLYQVMKDETEFVNKAMQEKLVMTLEMYVDGSARYFNNPTNVDDSSRIISYDIKDLSGVLKTQGMLLILDYIWNRLSENRNKGKLTYVYCDEIYLLFQDEYCLDYLRMLWKRARKYGGVLTGITQNVEDLLKDDKSRSMLSNSEFLILLNQNPVDAAKLQQILNFSDNEAKYLNDIPSGHGVVVIGSGGKVKIPFYDEFPKDTQLYSKMSTNFSEIAKAMRKKTNA